MTTGVATFEGRSRLDRYVAERLGDDARAALLGLGAVAPVAAVNGGYFPTTWGWSTIAFSWLVLLSLVLRRTIRLGRLELVALGGFAGLALWTAASVLWSSSAGASVQELEHTLVYVMAFAAMLLVARARSYRSLLGGVWAAIVLVSAYSLATKLVPAAFPFPATLAGNRLSEPLGYWNSLGALAALGALLAVGLVAHARLLAVRAAAAASLVPLTLTLYFTFSRGAWIAFGIGLCASAALDSRRLRLAVSLIVAAPWTVLAVALASQAEGLTRSDATVAAATEDGRRILLTGLLLAGGAAIATLSLGRLDRVVHPRDAVRRSFGGLVVVALASGIAAVFVLFGDPLELARKGYRGFNAPPVAASSQDLNARLFTFSGSWRVDLWRAAWEESKDSPLLGAGGGTYETVWLERRRVETKVVNAHNVYAETLAELGPVGLALLLAALAAPAVAMVRARKRALVPAAAGAYATYLVHAGVDWDWEITALTLAALACAGAALAAGRRDGRVVSAPRRIRQVAAVATVAVAVFAAVGLAGNRAAEMSEDATFRQDWPTAERQARRAQALAPWSAEPWRLLGEAQLQQGRLADARASFERGLEQDGRSWELWLDLAFATSGAERTRAARTALQLNPLSPEIAQIRPALGLPPVAP